MAAPRLALGVRICLGGTFDRLHVGHERLLEAAFENGTEVFIGLTSDRLARASRERRVRSYPVRERALKTLLRRRGWNGVVSMIDHPFGRSLEPRYDAIVVSPETHHRTVEINRERRRRGLRPLRVITIPFIYSDDGLRLSSTRMAAKEVDARGHRVRPLKVAVGSSNRVKVEAVRKAFDAAFPHLKITVRGFPVRSGVPEQPRGPETARGARKRAEAALRRWPGADYGVGVEAGIQRDAGLGRHVDVQYAVVVDKQGATSAAHGGGFYYPDSMLPRLLKGETVSAILGPQAGDKRLGSTTGAVGFLTLGALDRQELTRHAVLLALVPRIRRELYQE